MGSIKSESVILNGGYYLSNSEVLQIVFYFIGIISIMLGIYSLYMNPKAKLNQTFFATCISLSLWAIGFSMAIDTDSQESCLFWRRFAAVGWGSMYAFLLHFCLVYSEKRQILRKWWVYLLIYVPAIITVYIFAISDATAIHQYNLFRTSCGWTNVDYNNIWDNFFNLYYMSDVVIGLSIVWLYGRQSGSSKVKKQAMLMIYSFLAAFLAGSLTDILFNSTYMPQIAPIIILLPIFITFYSIIRFGFMNPNQVVEAEMILTESNQTKVYTSLSTALMISSFVCFIVQYLYYDNLHKPLLSCVYILMLGILVRIIKTLRIANNAKDIFLIMLIFMAIPSIILMFIDFGGVTIWAASFLFITISMVFNKPIVLLSVSASVISTQILLWIMKPEVSLTLDRGDYIGRIGILLLTIWIAYYVNKIYIGRLKINAYQLSIQSFVSEVSSDFINVSQSNIKEKMYWVIRIMGKLYSVDKINFLQVDTVKNIIESEVIWETKRCYTEQNSTNKMERQDVEWLMNQLLNSEFLYIPGVDRIPENASGFREWLVNEHVRSLVAMPLIEKDNSMMILQLISTQASKKWKDEELRGLTIIANIFSDAIMKVEAEKEISYMAYHDHLTGLPNRQLLRDCMNQAIPRAKRNREILGIIFLDLDSFKVVNDTLGHEGGDTLLKIVSEKLLKRVGPSDAVSRFGGDEFVILVNNLVQERDIISIADKIMEIFQKPVMIEGQEFYLTTSAGIAMYPKDGTDMDTLIKNADIAMYKAKENGKNQYMICTEELKSEVIKKIKITNSLYRALERGEFYIHYQPQISLTTGKVIGLEALIRWNHPDFGFISPSIFIPIAEQIGMINEIGEWVLKQACLQNKKWQDGGYPPVCMAVNVSANQLRNLNFAEKVTEILNETGLQPKFLEIEITESAAMNASNNIIEIMNKLRRMNIVISIDDFGTDYSSLSRLKELPIDKLKIDKRFVDGIETSDKDKAIVRTIINLAKNLELTVIAEGVEQENQMLFLKQELCDEIQGYYYYRPMPEHKIDEIFNKSEN